MSDIASSAVSVRLPESIRKQVEVLAAREGVSVEQFIASAVGEKLAVWMSLDHLREEAAQGRHADLEHFLAVVPDAEPEETDRIADSN